MRAFLDVSEPRAGAAGQRFLNDGRGRQLPPKPSPWQLLWLKRAFSFIGSFQVLFLYSCTRPRQNSVFLLAFSSDVSRCKWNEHKQLSKETQKVNCCYVLYSFIWTRDNRTSKVNAHSRDSYDTRREGEPRKLTIGAPLASRVVRVSRDACILPALLFFAEVIYYMLCFSCHEIMKQVNSGVGYWTNLRLLHLFICLSRAFVTSNALIRMNFKFSCFVSPFTQYHSFFRIWSLKSVISSLEDQLLRNIQNSVERSRLDPVILLIWKSWNLSW